MLTLKNANWTAVINQHGAELTQVTRNTDNQAFIWDDPEVKFWGRHAPVLFPVIGKSNNDQYKLDDVTYDMKQHGFARDMEWQIARLGHDSATLELRATPETIAVFPFAFTLTAAFALTESGIDVTYEVTNGADTVMPFALGFHPAFTLQAPLEEYVLELTGATTPMRAFGIDPAPMRNGQTVDLPTANGTSLPLSHALLDDGLVILNHPEATKATLVQTTGNHRVSLSLSDYPFVTLWSPEHKQAPFLCVEPFAGLPDVAGEPGDWRQKPGNQLLQPGAIRQYHTSVSFA